jgi:ATP-binding cassette subfamily F protein 3
MTALFQAIYSKLIPGIPSSLRVYLVRQIDDDAEPKHTESTLRHVLKGHVEREEALADKEGEWCFATLIPVLSRAIDAPALEALILVNDILVKRAQKEHKEIQRLAALRSGSRGKRAREDEIESEKALEELIGK